ncbi:MAG: 30S ribosomal protein S20 [Chlamydiia bacterium]|nr:30S ribosomal protein S20 [Chlamydiia bacterium]
MAEDNTQGQKTEKKKEVAVKRPSAQKRNLQSEKRRVRNRSFRASVHTAVRSLEAALSQKQSPEQLKNKLQEIYGIVDKGIKHGVFKSRKAARTKSRLSARCAKNVAV